jgi:hypothetical protein
VSKIHDQLVEVLRKWDLAPGVADQFIDDLLGVVRETVALGFERAASELQRPDMNLRSASEWLRTWADDARQDRRPVDLDRLPDTVEPLVITVLVGKDRPLDEDQIATMAAEAARRAVRTRQATR